MYSAKSVERARVAAAPLIAADRARFAATREALLRYAAQPHRAPLYLAGDAGIAALKSVTDAALKTIVADGPVEFYTTEPRYHAIAMLTTLETARDDADAAVLEVNDAATDEVNDADEVNAAAADAVDGGSGGGIAPARSILAADFWSPIYYVEEDTRRVAILWPLPRPPGGATRPPAIPATMCGGIDGLLCFPPELRLYEVYQKLCDLTCVEEWPRLIADEAALFPTLADLRARVIAATGGRADRNADRAALQSALRRFARGSGRALIPDRGDGPMQIVSANELDTDLESIQRAAERAGTKFQTRIVEIGLPTDTRLRRLKVYQKGPRGVIPVLDVFNAAEYAPVPLAPVVGGRGSKRRSKSRSKNDRSPKNDRDDSRDHSDRREPRSVSLYAELRFRVADLWTALLLYDRGVIDTARVRQLVTTAHAAMVAARAKIAKSPPAAVLPVAAADYLGGFVPADVLNRRGKRRYDGKMPVVRA